MKYIIDTNLLMEAGERVFDKYQDITIPLTVLEELDKLKLSDNEHRSYKARNAIRLIQKYGSRIHIENKSGTFSLPISLQNNKSNDNEILALAKDLTVGSDEFCLVSMDISMIHKAKALDIPCEIFEDVSIQEDYTGYRIIDEQTCGIISEELKSNINSLSLLENEYVIVKKSETSTSEFRYSNGKLTRLKLPELKGLKPKNFAQRCALDLLIDTGIPIKIIVGKSGSGKTRLAVEAGLYHVLNQGNYGGILFLRNPLGSGEEIGFLSGDKSEKIGDFFRCVQQYIDPTVCKGKDIKNYIEEDIPFYIKGLSYGSKYILTDEAEDMDIKLLRLIGTRIESDSCVVFCGDWKQAEDKFYKRNGLLQLIDKLKGNPLVGIVVLDEDVRSEASKVFADLL